MEDYNNLKIVREYDCTRDEVADRILGNRSKASIIRTWFEYGFIYKIKSWWRKAKNCINNHILFNEVMKTWYPYDYRYQLSLFAFGLRQLADAIENGHEIETTSGKKVIAIHRLADELERDYTQVKEEEAYFDVLAKSGKAKVHVIEYENGDISTEILNDEFQDELFVALDNMQKAIKKSRKEHYDLINKSLVGQDETKLAEKIDKIIMNNGGTNDVDRLRHDLYDSLFDGTGIENWWD